MDAEALESDLDLAYDLQLQEAITASLSAHQTSTTQFILNRRVEEESELLKLQPELNDHVISEAEFKRIRDDLHRRIHDRRVACEIALIPEDEWQVWGERFERPYGEGSSKGENDVIFKVYSKGLVEMYSPTGVVLSGIGVAICDWKDELLFELRKPLAGNGANRKCAELRALIEGLNAAMELRLERVVFYCDYFPIFNFVTGQWSAKQQKVSALVNQLALLRKKFISCQPSLVSRNDVKFAFKLAREAIISQVNKPAESSGTKNSFETCVICFEDKFVGQSFSVDDCLHRYCFSCMKQHVEVKLLHGMLPKCPHEGCNSELKIDSCTKFLSPRWIEIMSQRSTENAIPVTEKVYCPYPKCSALTSKGELLEYSRSTLFVAEPFEIRKCLKCNRNFCINCKVPWHSNLSCYDYKRSNPYPPAEDLKLKNLAEIHMWRQCVKCNHMIELAAGCFHMTCRCGYEFCYTCGAEWKNKAATCPCPLWDEDHIMDDTDEDEFDEEEEAEELYYFSDSSDYNY